MMNPIEMLERACNQAEAQIDAAASCPENRTACEDWNAQQLSSHVINSLRFNTSLMQGTEPDTTPFASPDIAPENLLAEFRSAAKGLTDAASAPGALEATVNHPAGDMPGAAVLMFPTFDTYVHAWDLEQATGLGQEFPADMTEVINGFCQQVFSGERDENVVKNAVDAPAGSNDMGQLAAFLGRTVG